MWNALLDVCAEGLRQLALLVGDWGLAIIIVTIVIRMALFPLQRRQYHSNFKMRQLQPKMKQIQEQYAGDQQKISEETMKLYQEGGSNPLTGCLPMLIQLPIFIILFQVLRNRILTGENGAVSFYQVLPDLTISTPDAWEYGFLFFLPYLIFAILFVVVSVIPMFLQMRQNPQQAGQTTVMLVVMGALFIWMAYISPAGVVLYWTFSSGIAAGQQFFTNRSLERKYEEEEEEITIKPVEVNVERREKKKRPTKKH